MGESWGCYLQSRPAEVGRVGRKCFGKSPEGPHVGASKVPPVWLNGGIYIRNQVLTSGTF